MKIQSLKILSFVVVITSGLVFAQQLRAVRASMLSPATARKSQPELPASFGKLPLSFEANQGQLDSKVKYFARGDGYGILLKKNEAIFHLRGKDANSAYSTVVLQFLQSNPAVTLSGEKPLGGASNYFIGNQPQQWRTRISNFERVHYQNLYRGIDLLYYGNQQRMEYDLVVAPHANPAQIVLNFQGTTAVALESNGDLRLQTSQGALRQLKPQAYQEINGIRQTIVADYVFDKKHQVRIRLGQYDKNHAVVIDPVILNSSYLGGSGTDLGRSIALGKDGSIFVSGYTASLDFLSPGPIQATKDNSLDVFVLKLNAAGSQLIYGTWLGGNSDDIPQSMQVDDDGNIYLSGVTNSPNFPITSAAFQKTKSTASDGFITKINAAGTALVYSTFLGGDAPDSISDVAVDSNGNAYLAGTTSSTNLPATGFQVTRKGNSIYKSTNQAASWTGAGAGIPSVQFNSIAFDPVTPATVYATTLQGVYKSTDGGGQWQQLVGVPTTPYTIVVDPRAPATLYAGTATGVYKSTDGGNGWQGKFNGLNVNGLPTTTTIVISPQNSQILYCGTSGGVFKSIDGGDNWTSSSAGMGNPVTGFRPPQVVRIFIDPANVQSLYAATNSGFFKSTDAGANWIRAQTGLPIQNFDPNISNAYSLPSSPNTIYALMANGQGLYKTTDGGTTWGLVTSGIPVEVAGQTFIFSISTIALDPTSSSILYASATSNLGIFKSTDGGKNWTQQNNGLKNLSVAAIGISPAGEILIGTISGNDIFAAKLNPAGSALTYLTFIGGDENDTAGGITVDKDGNAILIGSTTSVNYPTVNPYQSTLSGSNDVCLTKLNATGSALIWSTFLGGRSSDIGLDIAQGKNGSLFLGGYTNSTNFPTLNADYADSRGQTDIFVSKMKADGSGLEYSTYFGGSAVDQLSNLALDAADNIYFTGTTTSTDFPQIDPAQDFPQGQFTTNNAFVVKLSPTKSSPSYSTLIGGFSGDFGAGITVDALNQVYVTGYTNSSNFPVVNAFQPQSKGSTDAFIIKLGIEADVSVSQSQLRNSVMVNNPHAYTVTVKNNGPSPATGVKLRDVLPVGLTFVSATPSRGTCTNTSGTLSCDLGAMTLNQQITVEVNVTPTNAGKITHTVSVSSTDPDSTSANNEAKLETTISTLPSIAGRVTDGSGAGLQGVKITLTGGATTNAITDTNGYYQLKDLSLNGSYSVTATKANFSFEPPTRDFANLNADQTANFSATACAYSLYPSSQEFVLAGGTNTLSVLGTPRCPWSATVSPESASWLKITSGATGSGNGAIIYSVAPSTVPRSGFIRVANQTFVVFQRGEIVCATPAFRTRDYYLSSPVENIHTTDINGDSNPDIVYAEVAYSSFLNQYARFIKIYYGDGAGNLTTSSSIMIDIGSQGALNLVVDNDFNNDQKKDILLVDPATGKVFLFIGDGAGKFSKKVSDTGLFPSGGFTLNTPFADLDMDGLPDLIGSVNNGNPGLRVALNNGDGTFLPTYTITFASSSIIGIGDFTGDGISDVLARGLNGTNIQLAVYPGDGIGSFGAPLPSDILNDGSLSNYQSAVVGDFVSDGNLDLAISTNRFDNGTYVTSIIIAAGQGNGTFKNVVYSNISTQAEYFRLFKTDFNGDARTDLLAVSGSRNLFLANDGAGKFTVASTTTTASFFQNIADLNKDGKVDMLGTITSYPYGITTYLNVCGTNATPTIYGRVGLGTNNTNMSNVTVKLGGAKTASTKTDTWGNYQFTGLTNGANYTVKIEGAGFSGRPDVANITNLADEQKADFYVDKTIAIVSATTYTSGPMAKGSIVALFGGDMTDVIAAASTVPPPTELGGVTVNINGIAAKLLFVSPGQINLFLPEELPAGAIGVQVNSTKPYQQTIFGTINIVSIAPGLFTANSDGTGAAAAAVIYVTGSNQKYDTAATCLPGQLCTAKPIDLRSADNVFLELYGSGMRFNSSQIKAEIAGIEAEVTYSGAHCCFIGVDQVNVKIPKILIARGLVDLKLTVDGLSTNSIKIFLK